MLVGIFSLGSFAWDLLLGKCRSGSFVWKLSFVILRLGTFVWSFRLEAFVWGFSIWNVRLGTFALDLSFGNCRLGSFAWYYLLYSAWFGIFRLETCAWDLSLGNFCFGIFRLGELVSWGWGNRLADNGGTGGGTGSPDSVFEILSKNPSSEPSKGTIAKDKLHNIHEWACTRQAAQLLITAIDARQNLRSSVRCV